MRLTRRTSVVACLRGPSAGRRELDSAAPGARGADAENPV